MKRIKALYTSLVTLGRDPSLDISAAWERVQKDLVPSSDRPGGGLSSPADRHLIGQLILGALDESNAIAAKASKAKA